MKRSLAAFLIVLVLCAVSLSAQEKHELFGRREVIAAALKGDIYHIPEGTKKLLDFSALTPVGSIYTKKLDIPPRRFEEGFPGVTDRNEWFAIKYVGAFFITVEGEYGFRLLSDDGSRLYIDDTLIIDNDGTHPPTDKSGKVFLKAGFHSIRVDYFQGPRYDIALQLFMTAPGKTEEIFNANADIKDKDKITTKDDTKKPSFFGTHQAIKGALKGEIYYLPVNTAKLPDFSTLQPVGSIYTKKLDISPRRFETGFPGIDNRNEWFAIQYNGAFFVLKPGDYTFRILSDDGSKLYIDNKLVIDNDGVHPPQEKTAKIRLAPGPHKIRIEYFQGPRYDIALQVWITPPGGKEMIFESR